MTRNMVNEIEVKQNKQNNTIIKSNNQKQNEKEPKNCKIKNDIML